MPASDPNRDLLERAAELLQPLLDDVVFVGGCATGLLISDPASGGVRQTTDVDAIVEVASYAKYDALSERLRDLGFGEDSEDDVICRWRHPEVVLDLMPTDERILGFSNRWFKPALATARAVDLTTGRIRAIAPVYFLATKIQAFHGRGEDDLIASHDLEDAIAVIDGRVEIIAEVMAGEPEVRSYLSVEFDRLLGQPAFLEALGGFLLPDVASQARLPLLLRRLRLLAAASQMRLLLDDLNVALESKSHEVTRRAAADGTLLTGRTVAKVAPRSQIHS
jgi:hypothetical protein